MSLHQSEGADNVIETSNEGHLMAIDATIVDERSRFTLTERIKRMIPVEPNDVVTFYEDIQNDEIIFRIQHENTVLSLWKLKKMDLDNENNVF